MIGASIAGKVQPRLGVLQVKRLEAELAAALEGGSAKEELSRLQAEAEHLRLSATADAASLAAAQAEADRWVPLLFPLMKLSSQASQWFF